MSSVDAAALPNALEPLAELTVLMIVSTRVHPDAARALPCVLGGMEHMTSLHLYDVPVDVHALLGVLPQMPSMSSLAMDHCGVTDDDVHVLGPALARITTLAQLYVRNVTISSGAAMLLAEHYLPCRTSTATPPSIVVLDKVEFADDQACRSMT